MNLIIMYQLILFVKCIKFNKPLKNILVHSEDPIYLNNYCKQRNSQVREGEIKNLKMKIKQLEIQLCNTKQENDDKFKDMKKIIDCKETELKFQVCNLIIITDPTLIIYQLF